MSGRRRSGGVPTWVWALGGVATLVAALRVATVVRRERVAADAPIYLYWATPQPTPDLGVRWVPHLQREDATEHVTLSVALTEGEALDRAREEVEKRGGIPRQGQPV